MRFDRFCLSAVALLASGYQYGNFYGVVAEEEAVASEAPPAEAEPYAYPEKSEEYEFQAEVNKMLDIVVNSLYQNKDVFLRELISNAQDALDKIRFLSIENPKFLDDKEELEVRISYDKDEKSISVTDSGVGMTHDELVKNLGTVARSGTGKFLDGIKDGTADMSMIGQFGVGFYSAFLVSDRVRVASKHPTEAKQLVWESKNGESAFHVYDDPRGSTLGRGTEITLFLKEDCEEYLDESKLKELTTFYSEFLTHPIYVKTTNTEMVPKPKEETEDDSESAKDEDEDLEMKEDEDDETDDEDEEPEMEEITTVSWDQLNANKPIWTRSKEEITDDEYQAFWKVVSKDSYENATSWTHFNAEGNINFQSILYIPPEIPSSMMGVGETKGNEMKLYVKKVLISDTFELLPTWLAFVKGVVDSDDLPLNVNRETLQENKIIGIISKKLVRKVLEMLKSLDKEPEEEEEDDVSEVEIDDDGNTIETPPKEKKVNPYLAWYEKFHPSLKIGAIEDYKNRERIMKLLKFHSSKSKGKNDWVTLPQYIENMPEWQDQIFFMSGKDLKEIDNSDFMDRFKSKDVEVLYLDHPVDEYLVSNINMFDGKKFQSIAQDGVKIKDEDENLVKRRSKAYEKKFKPLVKFLKDTFNNNVFNVKISDRLEDAPAMVSAGSFGHTANMERLIKSQPNVGQSMQNSYKVLELNPRHPFIVDLNDKVSPPEFLSDEEKTDFTPPSEEIYKDIAWTLYDTALLNSGFDLTDVKSHSKRMSNVMMKALEVESLELADEIEPPEEDDEPPEEIPGMGGLNMDDFEDYDPDSDLS